MQGLAIQNLKRKGCTDNNPNVLEKKKKTLQNENVESKLKRKLLFKREIEVISKDSDIPLPDEQQGNAFLVGISGRRKSGKTHLLDLLMKTFWKKEFDKIFVLSKTAKYQPKFFASWKGSIFYIENWDCDFFAALREEQIRKPKQKCLIIIDDMSANMREKLYAANVDEFAFIGRHFRVSVVWLAQKITLFTPGFRQEADAFILFREENMSELRLLHREWGFGDMDEFLCQLVENTREQYSWIMLRNVGGTIHIFRPPTPQELQTFSHLSQSKDVVRETQPEPRSRGGRTPRLERRLAGQKGIL